jgi:DNA gyrase subunit B
VLETAGGARGGARNSKAGRHALRMRSLMGFVPRRYDPAVIEALALAGALDPELDREAREAALVARRAWLDAATARRSGARG